MYIMTDHSHSCSLSIPIALYPIDAMFCLFVVDDLTVEIIVSVIVLRGVVGRLRALP